MSLKNFTLSKKRFYKKNIIVRSILNNNLRVALSTKRKELKGTKGNFFHSESCEQLFMLSAQIVSKAITENILTVSLHTHKKKKKKKKKKKRNENKFQKQKKVVRLGFEVIHLPQCIEVIKKKKRRKKRRKRCNYFEYVTT